MANRAWKIDDSQFELPVNETAMPGDRSVQAAGTPAADAAAESTGGDPAAPEGAPAAGEAAGAPVVEAALALAPAGSQAGSLAGEEAMVRAFNQLRAAVRQATREGDPAVAGPVPGSAAHAEEEAVEAGREMLEAWRRPVMREDALFTFGPGGGRAFLSGGAGWTDVVRLQDVGVPPGPDSWSLELEAGTATEVDGAILLSEDAAGSLRLADGAELIFEGIERIEW